MIQVSNKVKVLVFLVCIVTLVSTVNSTYSRYVSVASGTVTTNFARWQLFVNNENITTNYSTSMTFTPVILPNENVAANKIAPSSKGYFDIAINPTNVDVSFTYDININIPNDSLITDIKVTDYAIVEGLEIEDNDNLEKISLSTSNLTNTLFYDNSKEDFSFEPFVIRMYFSWIDDENGTMSDADDTNIGNMIANGDDTKFELGININFKQYTGEEDNDDNGALGDEETPNVQEPTNPEDETNKEEQLEPEDDELSDPENMTPPDEQTEIDE